MQSEERASQKRRLEKKDLSSFSFNIFNQMPERRLVVFLGIIIIIIITALLSSEADALPSGPLYNITKNETGSPRQSTMINTTGGSITTVVFDATSQNMKWKAFVGNVSGKLVLAGNDSFSVYDWSLASVIGKVYATRKAETVAWNNIKCSNETHIRNEEIALNHTSNPHDNISATFDDKNHSIFDVGTKSLPANSCFSIHTNVEGQKQSILFEEILLYDGDGHDDGSVVYATTIEQSATGFNNRSYDFQMIVPEVAIQTWESSTAYYFYVEIT